MTSKINHTEEGRHKEWRTGGWMDGVGRSMINHGVAEEDTTDWDMWRN